MKLGKYIDIGQTGKYIDNQTNRQIYLQSDKQANILTFRQTDKYIVNQTNRQTY